MINKNLKLCLLFLFLVVFLQVVTVNAAIFETGFEQTDTISNGRVDDTHANSYSNYEVGQIYHYDCTDVIRPCYTDGHHIVQDQIVHSGSQAIKHWGIKWVQWNDNFIPQGTPATLEFAGGPFDNPTDELNKTLGWLWTNGYLKGRTWEQEMHFINEWLRWIDDATYPHGGYYIPYFTGAYPRSRMYKALGGIDEVYTRLYFYKTVGTFHNPMTILTWQLDPDGKMTTYYVAWLDIYGDGVSGEDFVRVQLGSQKDWSWNAYCLINGVRTICNSIDSSYLNIPFNQWHYIELRIKLSDVDTYNGIVQVWLAPVGQEPQLVIDRNDIDTTWTPKGGQYDMDTMNIGISHSTGECEIYTDDWTIDTSYIGPITSETTTSSTTSTTTTVPGGYVSISGQLKDKNGDPTNANIIVYDQDLEIASDDTDSQGNYGLSVSPGTYDLQFDLTNFYIPNYFIKFLSLDILSNVVDYIKEITGNPVSNRVSFKIDITGDQEIHVYSIEKPERLLNEGNELQEVSSYSELASNTWYYASSEDKLYIMTSNVLPTTTTTITTTTFTTTTTIPTRESTVGVTSIGSNWASISRNYEWTFGKGDLFKMTESGYVKSISVYLNNTKTTAQSVKVALYNSVSQWSGDANNVVINVPEVKTVYYNSPQWYTWDLATPVLLNPGLYWIGIQSTDSLVRIAYESDPNYKYGDMPCAWDSFPCDPFSCCLWSATHKISGYFNYTSTLITTTTSGTTTSTSTSTTSLTTTSSTTTTISGGGNILFQDSFEDDELGVFYWENPDTPEQEAQYCPDGWGPDIDDQFGAYGEVINTDAFDGSQSVRMYFPGHDGTNTGNWESLIYHYISGEINPDGHEEFYVSWYQKFTSLPSKSSRNLIPAKGTSVHFLDTEMVKIKTGEVGIERMNAWGEGYTNNYTDVYVPYTLEANMWYHFEYYYKYGITDGEYRLLVDGNEVIAFLNHDTSPRYKNHTKVIPSQDPDWRKYLPKAIDLGVQSQTPETFSVILDDVLIADYLYGH